ncbi:MAG: hypothetical protein JW959_06500 [Pirellulales bacterium]|nr:hypothetical protein [Pirellulales bacterium]
MIEITCPSCNRKLRAKSELAGRMGKCPNCGQPIRIAAEAPDETTDDVQEVQQLQPPNEERLPTYSAPNRLNRESRYLICDKSRLVALWDNNGSGWMLITGVGEIPVKRNRDNIPTTGTYQLVELKFTMTPEGKRLSGVACYELGSRWALTVLEQGDDTITEKITGPGCLNRDQKNAVRTEIKKHFMQPVWQDSMAVMDFLSNADFHSPGVE